MITGSVALVRSGGDVQDGRSSMPQGSGDPSHTRGGPLAPRRYSQKGGLAVAQRPGRDDERFSDTWTSWYLDEKDNF